MTTPGQVMVRHATQEDATAIGRVHVDAWRESYSGILPGLFLATLSYETRARYWRQALGRSGSQTTVHVLGSNAGIGGFVAAGPERGRLAGFDGEIYALYLLRAWQGHGYGRRLFAAAAHALGRAGYQSLALWVLEQNPARGFYEHLGGRLLDERRVIELGSKQYVEVAYGWPRLDEIAVT